MVTSYEVSTSFVNLLVEVQHCHVNRILVINPGSTSTKIGVFDNERPVLEKTIRHDAEQIEILSELSINMSLEKKRF